MTVSPFDNFRALLTSLPVADEFSIILAKNGKKFNKEARSARKIRRNSGLVCRMERGRETYRNATFSGYFFWESWRYRGERYTISAIYDTKDGTKLCGWWWCY